MKTINRNKLGEIGLFGENAAVDYLSKIGYEIIARNVICDSHEIDVIVRDMRYIVFVEVKTRTVYKGHSIYGTPASAVTKDKQAAIIKAAKSYLKTNYHRRLPRFDVIEVYVDKNDDNLSVNKINHIPRAFGTRR
jgi:putative endonuclease